MTPEQIIAGALRFDHRPTAGAKRIIEALRENGYSIIPSTVDLPETMRTYDRTYMSIEEARNWFDIAFEHGKAARDDSHV